MDDVHAVVDNILAQETDDTWLARARDSLSHGSKLAALWIERQLWETRHASLREVFQSEIRLATNIVRYPEFAEGVRALLIDTHYWGVPGTIEGGDLATAKPVIEAALADDGAIIDVLVLYTPDVEDDAAGGIDAASRARQQQHDQDHCGMPPVCPRVLS